MNDHIRLTKISIETKLELFILREFLKKNGFQIKAETPNSSVLVPMELYTKILKYNTALKHLQKFRIELLEKTKALLVRDITSLENFEKDMAVSIFLTQEYDLHIAFSQQRERDDFDVSIEDFIDTDDEEPSEIEINPYEKNNEEEYQIYNSYGYITSVYNIQEAREIALQFGGEIRNEFGRKL